MSSTDVAATAAEGGALRFGDVLGETICGVLGYSDGPAPGGSLTNATREFSMSVDGVTYNTGVKWDALEFVRRFIAMAKGVMIPSVPSAAALWDLQKAPLIAPSVGWAPVAVCDNGATSGAPQTGDIVVYQRSLRHPRGHAAVIVHVSTDGCLYVAEQGYGGAWIAKTHSRTLFLRQLNGMNYITEKADDVTGGDVLGWLHVMASFVDPHESSVPDLFRTPAGPGTVTRTAIERDLTLPWVDKQERCGFFLRRSLIPDGKTHAPNEEEVPSGYYSLDYDMWQRLHLDAERLHQVFVDVTREIILDRDSAQILETQFGIPSGLHPLLRASLNYPSFAGRFDIGYDGDRLSVFEYNCDSSAALLETAETQQLVAKHYGFDSLGSSAGAQLSPKMVAWWTKLMNSPHCPKTKVVHFLVDDDDEERYTALCVMRAAESAGFRCKFCVKLVDFKFAPQSQADDGGDLNAVAAPRRIVDLDNVPVMLVWKTWNWTTVISEYSKRAAAAPPTTAGASSGLPDASSSFARSDSNASGGGASSTASPASNAQAGAGGAGKASSTTGTNVGAGATGKPTLCDVLLSPYVLVLEPLWKAVCGSKALLPYVYRALPGHPSLLAAFFTLDASLEAQGAYVRKPVHGRGGFNVTVHDSNHGESTPVESKTGGRFEDDIVVFQEKCTIRKFDGYYPILCSWVIGNEFSGVAVREDRERITTLSSCVAPVRVVRSQVSFAAPAAAAAAAAAGH